MSIEVREHTAGFKVFTLSSGDQQATVSAFGGQLISWTFGGTPILWENREHAIDDGKTPYRGGAPICFSHFGQGTLLPLGTTVKPQHGHARTTVWDAEIVGDSLVLTTVQPAPDGYGPATFLCELTYSLSNILTLTAKVKNIGEADAPFQLAVHSYWATDAPDKAVITGLDEKHLDNLRGLAEHMDLAPDEPHSTPIDRIYLEATDDLSLTTEAYRLEIETLGCGSAVVWNPGRDHTLKDVGRPNFLCLETGQIVPPITLAPGEEHDLEMMFRAFKLQ